MRGLTFHGTTGKFTWRMLATVLGGQSIVIFFGALVARALAASGEDHANANTYLVVGSALTVLCVLATGVLRRPWGVTLGWVVQLLTLASAVVLPMMLIVGIVFLALWVTCLVIGTKIDTEQAALAAGASGGTAGSKGDGSTDRVTG